MLEPQSRMALTEQLAPPPGYELSHAVGTTFTLDLASALTIPLSFASRRVTAQDDQLGILEAVRRATDNVDVFAQAGALRSGTDSTLVAYLEEMVHPVANPVGALFHPKLWFLEYAAGDSRCYRFLCASRNLTSDRSWDVLVRLDGTADSAEPVALNDQLVQLLRQLPVISVQQLDQRRSARIDALADRWAHIRWENPPGLDLRSFHVGGMGAAIRPDMKGSQALIVSPFVTDDGLGILRSGIRYRTVLLSRTETLNRLTPASLRGVETYVLDEMAVEDQVHDTGAERLAGLHAKIVAIDYQRRTRLLVGSANATSSGWHRNVEVMVEFEGMRSAVGADKLLESMSEIVEQYPARGGEPQDPADEVRRNLDAVLRRLATLPLTVQVTGAGPYTLRVLADEPTAENWVGDDDVSVHWHLLRQKAERDVAELESARGAEITGVSLVDITPFVVFVARHPDGTSRSTLALGRLVGDIEERRFAVITSHLTDPEAFVRLLALMLELPGASQGLGSFFEYRGRYPGGTDADVGVGLFEALLTAVAAGHEGLAEVKGIVDQLEREGQVDGVIPEGFASLWDAVWRAYETSVEAGDE